MILREHKEQVSSTLVLYEIFMKINLYIKQDEKSKTKYTLAITEFHGVKYSRHAC